MLNLPYLVFHYILYVEYLYLILDHYINNNNNWKLFRLIIKKI